MRKLAWFSLFFTLAVAIYAALLPVSIAIWLGAAFLAAFGLVLFLRRGWSRAALALLGLAVGLLWTAGWSAVFRAPIQALDGQARQITVTARDDLQPTQYGAKVYANAVLDGHRCKLLVYFNEIPEARCGDEITLNAVFALPEGTDYDLYYRSIGVELIAYERYGTPQVQASGTSAFPMRLRRALKDKISELFPADAAPFLQALLTGDRSGLSYAQKNALSVSGIAHTVAISGMHVSILLGIVLLLCGNRRWLCAIFGIPIILIFTLMVGAQPSVVRAAIMQTLLLLAPLLLRENDPLTSLGLASVCILLQNPWAIANPGFQLSFASMLGILLFSGKLFQWLWARRFVQSARRHRVPFSVLRYAITVTASTLGASVFTIPIVAWQFGSVSLMSFVTNLLTIWVISWVFVAALLTCLLGFVWALPAGWLAWVIAWPIRYVLAVAQLIARMPISAVYTSSPYVIFWLIFVYCLFGVCLLAGKRRLLLPVACLSVLSLCTCLWLGYFEANAGDFQMTLLDVGQGQCLILTDGNTTLVYDCGSTAGEEAGETAARYLSNQGITRVDLLVLSHYDSDHASGVCQLLSRMTVDTLYLPEDPGDSEVREDILLLATQKGCEIQEITQDVQLQFESTTIQLFPSTAAQSDNEASLSMLYCRNDERLLVTGDLPASGERLLLSRHELPPVDILIAGHHGSAGSTCDTLLAAAMPETVLISVGADNSYGHPADETMLRIAHSGAAIYRTDECGTITIRR